MHRLKSALCNPYKKGVASLSPGLRYSATLGMVPRKRIAGRLMATPRGLRLQCPLHNAARFGCSSFESPGATPLGLGRAQSLSQGSRVRQPWAVRCNPVGIALRCPNSSAQTKVCANLRLVSSRAFRKRRS